MWHLRVFGSKCYALDYEHVNVLDKRGREGIFLGYVESASFKTYYVYILKTGAVVISFDVEFLEDTTVQWDGSVEIYGKDDEASGI